MLIFDIETNGFYDAADRVHCIVIKNDDGTVWRCNDQGAYRTIEDGLKILMNADEICGHNILKYDIPVLQKIYPWFKPRGKALDTLILARLLYPEVGDRDDPKIRLGKMPPKHRGKHSLEAWGWRLGVMKGEFDGPWESWTQEMEDYCVQDVRVTEALLDTLRKKPWPETAVALEHDVASIISRQEINGFHFDEPAARQLLITLSKRRLELEEQLKAQFGCWYVGEKEAFVPKAGNKKNHYTKDCPLTRVKRIEFNPGSRHHIARILQKKFGWKPESFTGSGLPEVSEESLKAIKHPEAAVLLEYLTVQKRLGQLAEGKEAWLKYVRNGRIHGGVNTLGTVTGRMSHSHPNVAQVPAVRSPYGKECRALFHARPGWSLVGCDAASLELRILAHYMARHDGGAYARAAVEGTKEYGTDVHSLNRDALGITSRDDAKTWFYAFIYGAGDPKLGSILSGERNEGKNRRLGKKTRAAFMQNLPAMKKLIEGIVDKAARTKALTGIDGRVLFIRSPHSAANTLFQAAGAIAMKVALVILDRSLQDAGLHPGNDYEFVANVHDEWQIECRPELADKVGEMAVLSIRRTGESLQLRCPLDGEFVVGRTWADTH